MTPRSICCHPAADNTRGMASHGRKRSIAFLADSDERYDLVLIEPPYSSAGRLAGPRSERLPGVVTENARIVSESDKRAPLELDLPLADERTYGDTRIAIHRGRR